MRKLAILLFMAMVAMAAVSASAAGVVGELGILDVSGTNPATEASWAVGDQYRIAFLSSGTTTGESADIAIYNAFVQGLATTAGLGGTWNIIGSTGTVDARDNTGTNPILDGIGVPVFLMDGTSLYATDYADLWNGGNSIYLDIDENGDQVTTNVDRIIAGTMNDGTAHSWQFLGSIGDGGTQPPKVQTGRADVNPNGWIQNFNVLATDSRRVYALSEPLTVKSAYAAKIVSPADGAYAITAVNPLTLSWTCPDSNEVASVYADVWFSTDPCALGAVTLPNDGLDAKTAGVDASAPNTYYWRVDVTVGDANTVEGDIWSFTTTLDALPVVVIDPLEIMTWSDQAVQLDATIDDNDEADVTFIWTASPDGLDDLNLTVDFVATDEDPVVTVTNDTGSMVTVTMTLTATDAHGDVEASSKIEVYSDACDMAKNGENIPVALTDLNADCVTDLGDLAIMAAAWLEGYASTEPK